MGLTLTSLPMMRSKSLLLMFLKYSPQNQTRHFHCLPYLRCASHTLNLISKNDLEKWLTSNNDCKAVYRSALAKCTALWTKTSRSTVASDQVEDVIKRKLIMPTATRWNSTHDALSLIIEIPIRDLNTICSRLGVKCITEREYKFLKEYCTVSKPAAALYTTR